MPQLDFYIFVSQFSWFLFIFFIFYFLLIQFGLEKLLELFYSRLYLKLVKLKHKSNVNIKFKVDFPILKSLILKEYLFFKLKK
jgi:hypothetical protein